MNKQELIERIKGLKNIFGSKVEYIEIDAAIELVSKLDEPQKITIPQCVADWIEYCKAMKITLAHALYHSEEAKNKSVYRWLFEESGSQEKFARAWLDGYEVEEEKRYRVRLKGLKKGCNCLNHDTKKDEWNFMSKYGIGEYRTAHTRKELEEAGFGWVFSCEGIEIEEVEE
ncbi:DUF1642 domain-containing protein [Streptococcus pseudopneumoniae]|uniref:DUF1642 domain-containing protein n=1 Tax=Streptococcus pseudopneumoniae TaxID=257758 RepID=UPI00066E6920|nr:DUF1642 domain-containing protein [Streptococcus pseudopneumoniae]